jgi:hypothetical protein
MDLQFTLNESVKRIVSEIRLKEYAHFSTILQTFFELNGISGLADLGITNLPALDRLYAIDRKVSIDFCSFLDIVHLPFNTFLIVRFLCLSALICLCMK